MPSQANQYHRRTQVGSDLLLCATSAFSVSRWWGLLHLFHHRDTENAEVAQRRTITEVIFIDNCFTMKQKPRITIRRATPDDAQLLAELGARTFQETFAPENTDED